MCYNHIIFIGKEISKNGKKPMKKFFSRSVCVMTAAMMMSGFAVRSCADDEYDIVIDISKDRMPISKYIYGINDVYGLDGLTASSVKQSDVRISSYNWETNTSNSAAENGFEYDFARRSRKTVCFRRFLKERQPAYRTRYSRRYRIYGRIHKLPRL